jgi:hypothetical protein
MLWQETDWLPDIYRYHVESPLYASIVEQQIFVSQISCFSTCLIVLTTDPLAFSGRIFTMLLLLMTVFIPPQGFSTNHTKQGVQALFLIVNYSYDFLATAYFDNKRFSPYKSFLQCAWILIVGEKYPFLLGIGTAINFLVHAIDIWTGQKLHFH